MTGYILVLQARQEQAQLEQQEWMRVQQQAQLQQLQQQQQHSRTRMMTTIDHCCRGGGGGGGGAKPATPIREWWLRMNTLTLTREGEWLKLSSLTGEGEGDDYNRLLLRRGGGGTISDHSCRVGGGVTLTDHLAGWLVATTDHYWQGRGWLQLTTLAGCSWEGAKDVCWDG